MRIAIVTMVLTDVSFGFQFSDLEFYHYKAYSRVCRYSWNRTAGIYVYGIVVYICISGLSPTVYTAMFEYLETLHCLHGTY